MILSNWNILMYRLRWAIAKMSFEDKDLTGDISGLGPFELEALQDWEYKFMSKYVKVGTNKFMSRIVTKLIIFFLSFS